MVAIWWPVLVLLVNETSFYTIICYVTFFVHVSYNTIRLMRSYFEDVLLTFFSLEQVLLLLGALDNSDSHCFGIFSLAEYEIIQACLSLLWQQHNAFLFNIIVYNTFSCPVMHTEDNFPGRIVFFWIPTGFSGGWTRMRPCRVSHVLRLRSARACHVLARPCAKLCLATFSCMHVFCGMSN